MAWTKLLSLEYLDKILNIFNANVAGRHQYDKADLEILLRAETISISDLTEAIEYLLSLGYIRKLPPTKDASGDYYKSKEYVLSFTGRLFLAQHVGFVNQRDHEVSEKTRLANVEKQTKVLTWILAVSAGIASIYYLVELFCPYRHMVVLH
jgi:hypothetical protein